MSNCLMFELYLKKKVYFSGYCIIFGQKPNGSLFSCYLKAPPPVCTCPDCRKQEETCSQRSCVWRPVWVRSFIRAGLLRRCCHAACHHTFLTALFISRHFLSSSHNHLMAFFIFNGFLLTFGRRLQKCPPNKALFFHKVVRTGRTCK